MVHRTGRLAVMGVSLPWDPLSQTQVLADHTEGKHDFPNLWANGTRGKKPSAPAQLPPSSRWPCRHVWTCVSDYGSSVKDSSPRSFKNQHPLERASFSFPRSYPFSSFSFSPFFFIPPISHRTPFHIPPLSTLPLVVCSAVEKTFLKVPLVFFIFYVLKMFVVLSPSFLLSNFSNLSLPQYLFPSSPATQKKNDQIYIFADAFSQTILILSIMDE